MAKKKADDSRASILAEIKYPLIFFALGLLIIEGLLTAVLGSKGVRPEDVLFIVIIMAALFVIVILVVAWLTWKVPDALMGQVREVARNEAAAVFETMGKRRLLGQLKKLQYELEAFDGERKTDEMQSNTREEGLSQNPYSVYIEPVAQRLLEAQEAQSFPPDVLDQLEQLRLSGSRSIASVRTQLEALLAHPEFREL